MSLIKLNFSKSQFETRGFEKAKVEYPITDVDTCWRKTPAPVLKSDVALLEMFIAMYFGKSDRYLIKTGRASDGTYVSEYTDVTKDPDTIILVTAKRNNTKIDICQCEMNKKTGITQTVGDGHKGTAVLAAMWTLLSESDPEFSVTRQSLYIKLDEYFKGATTRLTDEIAILVCLLTNNIYYRICKKADTNIVIPEKASTLKQAQISAIEIVETYSAKELEVFTKKITRKTSITKPLMSYTLSPERKFTEYEKALMVQMPDYYVCPPLCETLAGYIKESRTYNRFMSNILLYGPAGSGKSMVSSAIAEKLGLPFVIQTFGPDTQDIDLIGRLIPKVKTDGSSSVSLDEVSREKGIPSFDDVENDFEGTYEVLFGKKPGRLATPADCYSEICKKLIEASSENDEYVFVPSPLIQALKHGWVVELQEPTVIKRASVLVALNGLMENDVEKSTIQLPTGEQIHRHKDAVVIMTTNMDYEGCKGLQQSVLSRLQIMRSVAQPSLEVLCSRVNAQLHFGDDAAVKKMGLAIQKINDFQKDNDITDGITGPRELLDWAQLALIISKAEGENKPSEESIIKAAFSTVLSKCTQISEDRDAIISGAFKLLYSSSLIDSLSVSWEEGLF